MRSRRNDVEAEVEAALRRGWLGGGALRREDAQKVKELAPLLEEIARLPGAPRTLVDACCGKAALGVLAAHLLPVERLALVERDARLLQKALDGARALGVAVHEARTGDVGADDPWPQRPDVVVALHACGGASDAVIDACVATDAKALLLVPCCYGAGPRHASSSRDGAVRAQPLADAWLTRLPVPGHALVGKRMAQAFIDAERTLRLESAGWETEVVEVFPATVSPHNLLWRARRVKEPVRMARARERLAALAAV